MSAAYDSLCVGRRFFTTMSSRSVRSRSSGVMKPISIARWSTLFRESMHACRLRHGESLLGLFSNPQSIADSESVSSFARFPKYPRAAASTP